MSALRFFSAESGAVTVDWVVLTGAVVGLGLGAALAVRTGTADLGAEIGQSLASASVAAAPWVYVPMVMSTAEYQSEIAWMSDPTVAVEVLNELYANLAGPHGIPFWIDNGNESDARYGLDQFSATMLALEARGAPIPDGYPSVRDLYDRVTAAFG